MSNSETSSKWYNKTWLVVVLCLFIFPVGLYALWKNEQISKGWKIGVTVVIALLVIVQLASDNKEGDLSESLGETERKTAEAKVIGVGDVLQTNYFEIKVNSVSLEDRVNTGNQFANLKPEEGSMYIILNASFKNIDSESRMLTNGALWINYNGKDYQFDKSETIMLAGWGILLDQINPLTTKTTNLVYKIPAEIKGPAYWQPGRAKKNQRIYLGNL